MTDREAFIAGILEAEAVNRGLQPTYPPVVPGDRMQVFADWLDEHGEPDLAFAFRWAGRRGRFPRVSPGGRFYAWSKPLRGQHKPAWPHQLPRALYDAMRPRNAAQHRSRSLEAAFVKLAVALKVLRDTVAH